MNEANKLKSPIISEAFLGSSKAVLKKSVAFGKAME